MANIRLLSRSIVISFCFALFTGISMSDTPQAQAATPPANDSKQKDSDKSSAPTAETKPSITKHKITIGGKTLSYTATTGFLPMKDDKGDHKADIFYIAYTLDTPSEEEARKRPVTFTFNGGPGSSSVWLHIGALGPKRLKLEEEGATVVPPYELLDNEYTWLQFTDLVFIDPVGTGFSRPAGDEKREQFHGLKEDVRSVGDFIRLYTTRNDRWLSPKFLAGESYGTTRAAGLSSYLQQKHGMFLNGLYLISSALQFQTLRFTDGNDLPHALYIPAYAATAWYHKKLNSSLQQRTLEDVVEEVRTFANGDYLLALPKGSSRVYPPNKFTY
jgi:carboxypeptidase C (cathepsin A)